jgi:hypothetical protein
MIRGGAAAKNFGQWFDEQNYATTRHRFSMTLLGDAVKAPQADSTELSFLSPICFIKTLAWNRGGGGTTFTLKPFQ